ncbi:Alpha/Beta hydrolase protein [Fomitopsis serialis]|uniref:Alpha/Beta hydrolase protein n=1 Tax=Fomitopsis serialis TaxID=139415 RepID=UPI002007A3B2|nr:Alpha/Beta hydrolase protein [Neoantrodia serialis]KAH9924709.1 Alpha/Beta hydrolase protein [Neoantrodia serialis]
MSGHSHPHDFAQTESLTSPLTAEEVAGTDTISSLNLSTDGLRVIYSVGPHYRTGDHATSALWVADTSVENSATKITLGDNHDYMPSFHPTSGDVYFLSDRLEAGGPAKIYRLPLHAAATAEPHLAVDLEKGQGVSSYEISPDGKFVAFTMKDNKRDKDRQPKNDIRIWRDKSDLAALYVADLDGDRKIVQPVLSTEGHVESFVWCPDSRSIRFRTSPHADLESLSGDPIHEAVVDVASGASVQRECGDIIFLQNTTLNVDFSAQSLWDALKVVDLRQCSRYAVAVARGLNTTIDVFDAEHVSVTAYETHDDHISDWDMKAVGTDRYVFVVLRSSGVRGEPLEVLSGTAEGGAVGKVTHKLSSHNTWLSQDRMPVNRPFHWSSLDGQDVQGVVSHSRGAVVQKMPTIAVIHGGPTSCVFLDGKEWSWRHFLASQGYLVLSPNYRGSLGRGDKFVQAANGGMGTTDWMDVQSMIDQSVAEGMTDPDRVAIAGYSQGGFLTAWGMSRPNNNFKAGVDGAGVTDWGMLAASSALPDVEAALSGGAPWVPGETAYLRGSPIRNCTNVRAPLLLLHGEQDSIVPLSQAIAFLRGVERVGHPTSKPMLVIYPGEDHIFQQRVHAEDVLRRLAEHMHTYL